MKIWSWRQAILKSGLEATTKLVLLALSTYMNDHGEGCYPSQDQIALDTSLSKRSVINHIELAVQAGFLIKEKRNLQGKRWDANEYRASIPNEDAPDSPHHQGVQHIHPTEKRGEPVALEGCSTFTHGVNQLHLNSSKNSSKNSEDISPNPKNQESDFEEFWKMWPKERRCEKPEAQKAWREALKKIQANQLMEAARRYVSSKDAMGGFAPYPAKWLKRERWLELMPEAAPDTSPDTLLADLDDSLENQQFKEFLEELMEAYGVDVWRSWFAKLRPAGADGYNLLIRAPSRFVAERIRTHYLDSITILAKRRWPMVDNLVFTHL